MLFKSSLKTIIIGLGGIGLDYDLKKRDRIFSHAKSVSQSKNFDLIAGIDLVKMKRRIFSKIYKKPSFSNLIYLKKKNISFDLVIISVDTDKHLKIIKQLRSFNFKYCILEKPGGKNFREFKIILNILKRKGVKILLNYPRNYFNHYNKLTKILGTFILANIEGVELTQDVKDKMKDTLLPYDSEITKGSILSIFQSLKNKREESIINALEKLKQEETV